MSEFFQGYLLGLTIGAGCMSIICVFIVKTFFVNGLYESWHKTPSLKLVEKKNKAKRKVMLY